MKILSLGRAGLLQYVLRQLHAFFPDEQENLPALLEADLDQALERLRICVNAVRLWPENQFDYLHSTQYAMFLYFLSNTIWRNRAEKIVCTKLFYLNKALNGIDCFYEVELPSIFFIGHTVGIVLAKASYADYLVLYQNSTVGKNHGVAPVLGQGVVMYPNTAIIGRCDVKSGSVIAQGVSVINHDTPGDCLVFQTADGGLMCRHNERDILADIFRR